MNYSFIMTKYYFICDLIFTLLTWVHLMGPILFPLLDEKQHWLNHCLHESRLWVQFRSLDEEQQWLNQLWVQFCFSSLDEEQCYVCLHESRLWVQFCLAYFRLVYSWRYALGVLLWLQTLSGLFPMGNWSNTWELCHFILAILGGSEEKSIEKDRKTINSKWVCCISKKL